MRSFLYSYICFGALFVFDLAETKTDIKQDAKIRISAGLLKRSLDGAGNSQKCCCRNKTRKMPPLPDYGDGDDDGYQGAPSSSSAPVPASNGAMPVMTPLFQAMVMAGLHLELLRLLELAMIRSSRSLVRIRSLLQAIMLK